MSTTFEEPLSAEVASLEAASAEPEDRLTDVEALTAPRVNAVTATLAAAISTAAAAWMVAGIFQDFAAHLVGLAGVVIGGGIMAASYRVRNGTWLQYMVIPTAVLAGVILVAPDATGGSASFIGQIGEAVKAGTGLMQQPISFDPGWRAILVVAFALLAAGAAGLAVSLQRPKVGVALPVPLIMAAALVQPPTSGIPAIAVALVLVVMAMTFAYGAELSRSGGMTSAFESRRLIRGVGVAAALGIVVVLLGNVTFLFPQPNHSQTIPPQRPQAQPPEADHVLFTYTINRPNVPLQLGVIDQYDLGQQAWLLPSYDGTRLKRLAAPTDVPQPPGVSFASGPDDVVAHIRVADATGHSLPDLAGLGRIEDTNQVMSYDPETGGITLADRPAFNGLTYTVVGAPIASAKDASGAGPPIKAVQAYLAAPSPPNKVTALLNEYSQRAAKLGVPEDPFTKVEYLRQSLADSVIAAGVGSPKDVNSARVEQMLNGGQANPYEIVAAEALLARWAGVPSRIGYGYYGGDKQQDGSYAIHPRHGAMWLEVWFNKVGWVALYGTPPRAKASTSQEQKNQVNSVSINQIQLVVYVPIRYPTLLLLFEYLQWYLTRIVPVIAILLLLHALYPWLMKLIRSRYRRRWGRRHGPVGRIAVAYSEFRDCCRDLSIGDPVASPVTFVQYVVRDDEHRELAWLVSRSLWGDLRRDLRDDDADAAEHMAASVTKRIRRAQPGLSQVLARVARTSLREPYSAQVPNFWFELRLGRAADFVHRWRAAGRRRALLRRRGVVPAVVALGAIVLVVGALEAYASQERQLPAGLVPTSAGAFTFKYESAPSQQYRTVGSDSLASDGAVYSVHRGDSVDGALEVALFKPGLDVSDINDESRIDDCSQSRDGDGPDAISVDCPGHEILIGLQQQLGSRRFQRVYLKTYERAYEMNLPDQRIYLWFPPGTDTMVMLILVAQVSTESSDALFATIMDYQHHTVGNTPLRAGP